MTEVLLYAPFALIAILTLVTYTVDKTLTKRIRELEEAEQIRRTREKAHYG